MPARLKPDVSGPKLYSMMHHFGVDIQHRNGVISLQRHIRWRKDMADAPDASVDWSPISQPPKDGERVRVRHEIGTHGGSGTGVYRDGKWSCSIAFICPRTLRMFWTPTHWAPLAEQVSA